MMTLNVDIECVQESHIAPKTVLLIEKTHLQIQLETNCITAQKAGVTTIINKKTI